MLRRTSFFAILSNGVEKRPTSRFLYPRTTAAAFIWAVLGLTACGGSVSLAPDSSHGPEHFASVSWPQTSGSRPCGAIPCIYVASPRNGKYSDKVTTYGGKSDGNVAPLQQIKGSETQLDYPYGIAADASGAIYVANDYSGTSSGSVTVYASGANGNVFPSQAISGSNTGLYNPFGIALDPDRNIYVANADGGFGGSVNVFAVGANGNVSPFQEISGSNTGLNFSIGIALDADLNIYVANYKGGPSGTGSVTVYAQGANGNVAPVRSIAGSNTLLSGPFGIAVDAAGEIYVTNGNSGGFRGSVTVYGATANGNVAPIDVIIGSKTGLNPFGIALDANDNIYVANQPNKSGGYGRITVYPAGANGNIAPIRTVIGSRTALNYPVGIAVQ